jgi:hypothetical protein
VLQAGSQTQPDQLNLDKQPIYGRIPELRQNDDGAGRSADNRLLNTMIETARLGARGR